MTASLQKSFFFVLLALAAFISPLAASKYPVIQNPWYTQEPYVKKIEESLQNQVLPFLAKDRENPVTGTLEGLQFLQTDTENAVYFWARLITEEESYLTLFLLEKSRFWKDASVKPLYTINTEAFIPPVLLEDVLMAASGLLPEDPEDFFLMIEKKEGEDLKENQFLQIWSFSNSSGEKHSLEVFLELDEKGETNFAVSKMD